MAKMVQSLSMNQSLRMTPQLQQAIKMLQLSRMELETQIRSELEENPILEDAPEISEQDFNRIKEASAEIDGGQGNQDQDPQRQDEFEWENYVETTHKPMNAHLSGHDEIQNYENSLQTSESLHDYLNWQAKMWGFNEEELQYVELMIDYIDDDGYILTPLEQIALEEKVELKELEEIIPFVQEFDPPGVGARNLKECLILQAKALEEDTKDLVHIINHHLKDLEKKNYDVIAKNMGRDPKEVMEICKIIYSMDPKPGLAYSPQDTHYVTPDVYVYKVGDEYLVTMNEDGLPRLKISNYYKNILKSADKNEKTQTYIQDKLRSAVWLIKSIHQRQRTIFKVTESIVKHQREFFDKGVGHIKPMVLRDVAQDIGMHESTVSRVTTSKYVYTPQGIFELKYFFNSGISTTDGDSLASESVKIKIKEIVAKEDIKNPFSDQQLVDLLRESGIKMARRTVAKYREMLRILPSSRRKKVY